MGIQSLQFSAFSIPGSESRPNYDSYFVNYVRGPNTVAAGVFDGVGAEKKSSDASLVTSDIIQRDLSETGTNTTSEKMCSAVFDAHFELERLNIDSKTTGAFSIVFPDERCLIGSSGDSRVYKFDGKELTMLTLDDKKYNPTLHKSNYQTRMPADQGLTLELLDQLIGSNLVVVSAQDLQKYLEIQMALSAIDCDRETAIATIDNALLGKLNHENVINNAISADELPRIVVTETTLKPGEKLFLSTDGLYGVMPTELIKYLLSYPFNAWNMARTFRAELEYIWNNKPFRIPTPKRDDATGIFIEAL